MGENNSSECRVVPMMKYMLDNKKDLAKMLGMVDIIVEENMLNEDDIFFGDKHLGEKGEKALKPSCDYLCKIIMDLPNNDYAKKKINHSNKPSRTTELRKQIIGDKGKREAAIESIVAEYSGLDDDMKSSNLKAYILEGSSKPDVFIETADKIIVIEGKWTEKKTTESTTYILNRNQMVRHIHGTLNYNALKHKDKKKVYGFYIVSDKFTTDNDISIDGFKNKLDSQFGIEDCYEGIGEAYKGYITWEELQKEFPQIMCSKYGWKEKPTKDNKR